MPTDNETPTDAPSTRTDTAFAAHTPLVQALGGGSRLRILAALESEETGAGVDDLPASEIARLADDELATSTVTRNLPALIEAGYVVKTRTVSGTPRYALADTEPANALRALFDAQTTYSMRQE